MTVNSISFLASFTYFVASLFSIFNLSKELLFSRTVWIGTAILAVSLHGYTLYRWIDTPLGQNLSLSHVFSLTCWLIALLVLSISIIKRLDSLSIFILPISAVSILLAIFFPGIDILKTTTHPSTLLHILISILAFGILGIAALQASLLCLQNRILRTKSTYSMIRLLPPLQTMETFLFQIIWFGFLLLSASLATAFLLVDVQFITHYIQKIILSLLAWGLFAALLYGHYQAGWRGLKAIRWTFSGVSLLIGAYLAQKLIQTGS